MSLKWTPQIASYVNIDPKCIHYGKTRWLAASVSPIGTRWYWHGHVEYGTILDYCNTTLDKQPVSDSYRFRWMARWRARRIERFVKKNFSLGVVSSGVGRWMDAK